MILVDTSAWIDFFRGRIPLADDVENLLVEDRVAICGPVESEVRRGLADTRERRRVIPLLQACHPLSQPPDLWEAAGDLGFALRRKGSTVKTLDLLIAVFALHHEVRVLTGDSDFSLIQKHCPELLLRPVT